MGVFRLYSVLVNCLDNSRLNGGFHKHIKNDKWFTAKQKKINKCLNYVVKVNWCTLCQKKPIPKLFGLLTEHNLLRITKKHVKTVVQNIKFSTPRAFARQKKTTQQKKQNTNCEYSN